MDHCVSLAKVVVGQPVPAVRKGADGFTDWLILAIHCLRERETETYRSVVDKFKIMGPIPAVLDIDLDDLPQSIDAVQGDGSAEDGVLTTSAPAEDHVARTR